MKQNQINQQEIIEFVDWCYSPVYQKRGQLSFERRVVSQAPDHLEFAILDEKGDSLLGKGIFLNTTQLFEYWLNNIKNDE